VESRRSIVAAALLTVAVGATACACGSTVGSAAPTPSAAAGSVTVFAAASLTESFEDLQTTLRTAAPRLSVTYSFAGSGALAAQIQQGAPADVVATADTASMQRLVDAGLVEAPATFARNTLEMLVAPGNPKGVRSLSDLGRADVKVILEDDTVPAGKYAARALATAGVTVHPVSRELDVKAAVAKVAGGEADATIVYVSDVAAAGTKAQGVAIPDALNVTAEYPVAVVKSTGDHAAAAAFVDAVRGAAGQDALRRHGFAFAA
jgi:molybdate transport system substrate-binding protein